MGGGASKPSKPKGPSQEELRNVLAAQNEAARYAAASKGYQWFSKDDDLASQYDKGVSDLETAKARQSQVNAMGGHGYYNQKELDKAAQDIAAERAANPFSLDFGTKYEGSVAGFNVRPDSAFTTAEQAKNAEIQAQFDKMFAEREAAKQAQIDAENAKNAQATQNSNTFRLTGAATSLMPEAKIDYKGAIANKKTPVRPNSFEKLVQPKQGGFVQGNMLGDSDLDESLNDENKPFTKGLLKQQSNKLSN